MTDSLTTGRPVKVLSQEEFDLYLRLIQLQGDVVRAQRDHINDLRSTILSLEKRR